MRTTLTIDDDLLQAAKALAESKAISIGRVISELLRKGLLSETRVTKKHGFPVFRVSAGARPVTLADVKRDEDEA